jgi:hypothetical protein
VGDFRLEVFADEAQEDVGDFCLRVGDLLIHLWSAGASCSKAIWASFLLFTDELVFMKTPFNAKSELIKRDQY